MKELVKDSGGCLVIRQIAYRAGQPGINRAGRWSPIAQDPKTGLWEQSERTDFSYSLNTTPERIRQQGEIRMTLAAHLGMPG